MVSRRTLLLASALSALPALAKADPRAPAIAAAADLRFALDAAAARFRAATGQSLRISYGSSGLLFQQIVQGAPFELFLSADEAYALALADRGRARDRGAVYAIGRLVVVAPDVSPLKVDGALRGLREALAAGRIRRFAIAAPDHAPYGRRAREALQHAGLWHRLEPRLVLGENVAQALQFATTGGAQGGIVAWSLVQAPGLDRRLRWALIPDWWHQPLRQRMVLLDNAGATARALFAFLQGKEGRAILARHGFVVPAGGPAQG